MIPKKLAPVFVGLILSGFMSLIVSGVATVRILGPGPTFLWDWLSGWSIAWAVAFPVILLAGPVTRRMVASVTRP